jgi:hypothetical protein
MVEQGDAELPKSPLIYSAIDLQHCHCFDRFQFDSFSQVILAWVTGVEV